MKKLSSVYIIFGNFGDSKILLEKCVNLDRNDSNNQNSLLFIQSILYKNVSKIKKYGIITKVV